MVTTRVTFRSTVVNMVLSFIGNMLVKAILVSIGLRVLFPNLAFDVVQIIVVGGLWQVGHNLVFNMHFEEIITKTQTSQPQTEADWLAKYGIHQEEFEREE